MCGVLCIKKNSASITIQLAIVEDNIGYGGRRCQSEINVLCFSRSIFQDISCDFVAYSKHNPAIEIYNCSDKRVILLHES